MEAESIEAKSIPLELKLRNRFYVEFPPEFNIPEWVSRGVTKPRYIRGSSHDVFENITIKMMDPIGPSTSEAVFKMKAKEDFKIYIKSLDPTGVIIETWMVEVRRVKFIDFGSLSWDEEIHNHKDDYGIDNIVMITMNLEVKNCTLIMNND